MRRFVLLAAVAACGSAPKPPPGPIDEAPRIGPVGEATCNDVSGQAAELGASEDDQANMHRDCVEDAWSDDAIACVMKAPSKQDALQCAVAETRGSPLCTGLEALIGAMRSNPPFAAIRGERTGDEFYLSTVQLPDGECRVDDFLQIVVCRIARTDDRSAREDRYARLRAKITACIGENTWAPTLGYQMVKWVHADGRQISMRTEEQGGTYGLFVYIGDPTDAE